MASKSDFRVTHYAAAITLGLLVAVSAALAHQGATGIVKTRMDAMKAAADALKPVGAMAKGKQPYDASKVAAAARVVHEHAQKIPELFPPGTASKQSEARDLIWTDWNGFKTKVRDGLTSYEDPGWYQNPPRTLALPADKKDLQRDGIKV